MPHLSGCLDVLLKQYNVFITHFENSGGENCRAKLVLKHLKEYDLLLYKHFLKDVLAVLSELSLQFQNRWLLLA